MLLLGLSVIRSSWFYKLERALKVPSLKKYSFTVVQAAILKIVFEREQLRIGEQLDDLMALY